MSKKGPREYPMQPIVLDEKGQPRFKANPIIHWLVFSEKIDLNEVARHCRENDVPKWAQEQFAQLMGYSVGGFGELHYVRDAAYNEAARQAEELRKANP